MDELSNLPQILFDSLNDRVYWILMITGAVLFTAHETYKFYKYQVKN